MSLGMGVPADINFVTCLSHRFLGKIFEYQELCCVISIKNATGELSRTTKTTELRKSRKSTNSFNIKQPAP